MFTIFPSLLTYRLLGPTILRITLGIIFAHAGWHKTRASQSPEISPKLLKVIRVVGWIEILIAISMIAGIWTQIGALAVIILSVYFSYIKTKGQNPTGYPVAFNFLLIAIALSLLVSGAGKLAFDLPL
jgi:uncharacterized membrane protein YphA (DoxX/SURF4 family)